jgi:exopolysaccharide biosynthesis WecB/TagA/CpsF family protein
VGFLIYSGSRLHENRTFSVFGIKINNANLAEALKWMFSTRSLPSCEIGFFVNVNSINIALKNSQFKNTLQSANRVFADGSGIRLAASHTGERLRANLNGTDLLPHICRAAVENNKSIYLLGSDVGIAEAAANNLKNEFVGLQVAGCHHGYFKNSENEKIINEVNESGAHICLVALGSPLQETWLLENAHRLNCSTALAVGGLLDFYSGKIPRSPSWLRELGFEWVWRLLQEPVGKFNRYVVGNPVFLIRTFILNQARG